MEPFIVLAVLIICYPIFKYLIIVFNRIIFYFRLKNNCKKNNYNLRYNPLSMLLCITSKNRCDFHIEADDEILSVKFFMTPGKNSILTITGDNHYSFSSVFLFLRTGVIPGKYKSIADIDFLFNIDNTEHNKIIKPYLLISPACKIIYYEETPNSPQKREIGEMEYVNFYTLISQRKLLEIIDV